MADSLIGTKEEITDLFNDETIRNKDVLAVGKVAIFDYEGSKTCIKITRIDRKNARIWGKHISLSEANSFMSHYGHQIDKRKETVKKYGTPFCLDCRFSLSHGATEEGNVKAHLREQRKATWAKEREN